MALDLIPGKQSFFPQVRNFSSGIYENTLHDDKKLVNIAKEVMEKCRLKPLKEESRSVYTGKNSVDNDQHRVLIKTIGHN